MTKEELDKEAYQYDAEHLRNGRGARWYHNVTIRQAYLAGAEPREKRIAELEKENAELKDKYDSCLRENTGLKIHNTYVEKKLTEAKEIIKKFLNAKSIEDTCVAESEAEQFLREIAK